MVRPFIRFPGGKSKHVYRILQYFNEQETEYREPFVGGGSVYLGGTLFTNSWINDLDEGVYDLWRRVKEDPNSLIDHIEEHTPVLDHRKDPKRIKAALALWKKVKLDTNNKLFSPGYRFLFLSKTCFSGVVTGGPTGGTIQNHKYNLTSRWAKQQTIKRIREVHRRLWDCKITNFSWEEVVKHAGENVAMYLDPPYLDKGSQCYRESFTEDNHRKLAEVVTASPYRYVVTVDDLPSIRNIWADCGVPKSRMISETWLYSMSGKREQNKQGSELFIMDEQSIEISNIKSQLRGDV